MKSAVINVKVTPEMKKAAHEKAEEMGISLSAAINGFLTHMIKTESVILSISDMPSKFLIDSLKESAKDIKKGKVSPGFKNVKDAIAWLENPKAKYQNGDKV